jgi:hypothetical protein
MISRVVAGIMRSRVMLPGDGGRVMRYAVGMKYADDGWAGDGWAGR